VPGRVGGQLGGQGTPRTASYGASALLAAAVLSVVVLSVWSRTPDAPRGLEPQPSPATGWEAVLRNHLPPGIAATCTGRERPSRAEEQALVTLVCTPGLPVLRVQYSVLPDVATLRARHRAEVRAHLTHDAVPGAQTCGTIGGSGAGAWWMAPLQSAPEDARRHLGTPPSDTAAAVGRVACWWGGDAATLAWYDEDTLVYAWARTTPGLAADLFTWWRRGTSGPWHPPVGGGPYRQVAATGLDPRGAP
jgi:hypothetical protein